MYDGSVYTPRDSLKSLSLILTISHIIQRTTHTKQKLNIILSLSYYHPWQRYIFSNSFSSFFWDNLISVCVIYNFLSLLEWRWRMTRNLIRIWGSLLVSMVRSRFIKFLCRILFFINYVEDHNFRYEYNTQSKVLLESKCPWPIKYLKNVIKRRSSDSM